MNEFEDKARELFGKDTFSFFEIEDKWNVGNILKGYISHKATELYGALFITHINNLEAPQLIYGTPKMHYPFDKNGVYNFPPATSIEIYTKLDGTNILAYYYYTTREKFLTFKTRLTPTVTNGKWGNFESMLRDMIQKYPQIPYMNQANGFNISYELVGARNKHLIDYDFPLDIRILFGISKDGIIIPPSKIRETYNVPKADLETTITRNYIEHYEEEQKRLERRLIKLEEGYQGQEGQVWYLNSKDKWLQIKAKPETIETIHFASGGINKNSILTTCINAFENYEEIDYDKIKKLLSEDFNEKQIEAQHYLVLKCIKEVKEQVKFKESVLVLYQKTGLDINIHKKEVMGKLSKHFDKKQMNKVYSIIVNK